MDINQNTGKLTVIKPAPVMIQRPPEATPQASPGPGSTSVAVVPAPARPAPSIETPAPLPETRDAEFPALWIFGLAGIALAALAVMVTSRRPKKKT